MAKRQDEWLLHLTKEEISELENAGDKFLSARSKFGDLDKEHFLLPTLGRKLNLLTEELIHGRGFFLLRGLPVENYSEEQAATIFYGRGSHLGNPRSQNAAGHVLGHVCNFGVDASDPKIRYYQTDQRQTFHTDSCDVVGLLCMQPAKTGGESLLVSADTIFNEMRVRRPDLLELLMEPIATDRRGEVPEGMLPYLLIPVFSSF